MKTILIVDDLPANLSMLIDTLGQAGLRVLLADSGELALELAETGRPDLILLDVCMPGMDGIETCRQLKGRPETAEIPVIFVTALGELEDKVAGLEAGGVDYVTKPLQPGEVLARVRVHLELRALQVSLAERNAELERARRALGQSLDRAVMVATREGRVLFSTERAARLLAGSYAVSECADPDQLPVELEELVTAGGAAEVIVAGGALRVRLFTEGPMGECVTLWLEERNEVGAVCLEQLGLTPREAEVLYWISAGKSNPEIAIILGNTVGTVKKQVQFILMKLGCESRLAAALRAKDLLEA